VSISLQVAYPLALALTSAALFDSLEISCVDMHELLWEGGKAEINPLP
jgi:hypothetical protein